MNSDETEDRNPNTGKVQNGCGDGYEVIGVLPDLGTLSFARDRSLFGF